MAVEGWLGALQGWHGALQGWHGASEAWLETSKAWLEASDWFEATEGWLKDSIRGGRTQACRGAFTTGRAQTNLSPTEIQARQMY